MSVVFPQILGFQMPPVSLPINSHIIHHRANICGGCLLATEGNIVLSGYKHLRLEGKVVVVCPKVLLVGQSGAIEDACFKRERQALADSLGDRSSDIADIADLLGDERAVGEILKMRRTRRVD